MKSKKEILVFKTNILNNNQIQIVYQILKTINDILKISVDLEDKDKVLRIESIGISPNTLIQSLKSKGFEIEELSS